MLINRCNYFSKLIINPNYIRADNDEIDTRKRYPIVLDIADTIYITNYLLGYFAPSKNALDLMEFQKIEDLKKKGYIKKGIDHSFKKGSEIDLASLGINIRFVGTPNDSRKKIPEYLKLLDLTSSHINYGGWQCSDFVVTQSADHDTVKFIKEESEIPNDEYILGWIRCDSGVLNNKPLQEYLGQAKLMPDFVNAHIMNAKVLVPTQPFGSKYRGGKLLALLSQSNEIRNWFNERYKRNIILWYSMSLYGSTKPQCQYDQLDRYIKFIGKTESKHFMRMQNPHFDRIKDWLDRRGIERSKFSFRGSSKADRSFRELVSYVEYCLWYNKKDITIRSLKDKFDSQLTSLLELTESKRCYVSTYGLEHWDDNLINVERVELEQNSLVSIFEYWKKKILKGDWGMRKYKSVLNPTHIEMEYLNEKMRKVISEKHKQQAL